jgi:hypothetical protein
MRDHRPSRGRGDAFAGQRGQRGGVGEAGADIGGSGAGIAATLGEASVDAGDGLAEVPLDPGQAGFRILRVLTCQVRTRNRYPSRRTRRVVAEPRAGGSEPAADCFGTLFLLTGNTYRTEIGLCEPGAGHGLLLLAALGS